MKSSSLAPSFDFSTILPPPATGVQEHTEIEIRFFASCGQVITELAARLPETYLFQAYFPAKALPFLRHLFGPAALQNVRTARVRHCARLRPGPDSDAESETWTLQFKSKRVHRFERTEHEIMIGKELFLALLPLADAGSLRKLRYVDTGWVVAQGGRRMNAEAHIDLLLEAGRGIRDRRPARTESARAVFIEVEVPDRSLCRRLRFAKLHSFPYLRQAVEIPDDPAIRRPSSTRHIANAGLDHRKVKEVFRKLRKLRSCRA